MSELDEKALAMACFALARAYAGGGNATLHDQVHLARTTIKAYLAALPGKPLDEVRINDGLFCAIHTVNNIGSDDAKEAASNCVSWLLEHYEVREKP